MSMEPKTIAYAHVTFDGEGGVVAARLYNCTVADAGAGVGDFNLTLGQGGADRQLCQCVITPEDTATCTGSTIHTSDTVKRIQFRDDAGALAAPVRAWIEVKRMPPLPTP